VLKDLQRVLDEMALGVGTDAHTQRNAALILEAVPVVGEGCVCVRFLVCFGCGFDSSRKGCRW